MQQRQQTSDSPADDEQHPNQGSLTETLPQVSEPALAATEENTAPSLVAIITTPSPASEHCIAASAALTTAATNQTTVSSATPAMTGVKQETHVPTAPLPMRVSIAPEDDESATLVTPPFIAKLSSMLENSQFGEYIHWNEEGDTVIVKNLREFANIVIPKYFKHNNFASFLRQLNMYYFSTTRQGQNWREFKNPLFCKDNAHMHKQIKRKGNVSSSAASSDGSIGSRSGRTSRARGGVRAGSRASTGKRPRDKSAGAPGIAKTSAAAARRKLQQQQRTQSVSGGLGYVFAEGNGLCVDGTGTVFSGVNNNNQWAKTTPLLVQDVQGLWQKLRETCSKMSSMQQVIHEQRNIIDRLCAHVGVQAARPHQQQQQHISQQHSFANNAGQYVVDSATGNMIQQQSLADSSSAMGYFDVGSSGVGVNVGAGTGSLGDRMSGEIVSQLGGQKKHKTGRRKSSRNVAGTGIGVSAAVAGASSSRRVIVAAEAAAAAAAAAVGAAAVAVNGQQQQQQHSMSPYMLPRLVPHNPHSASMMMMLPRGVSSSGQPVLSVPHQPVVLATPAADDDYLVDAYGDALADGFSGDNHSPNAAQDSEELEQASAWFTEGSNDFGDVMFD